MWGYLAVFVIALVASYALAPKPQRTPPPAVGEIEAPTAEEGIEIPVLFGCRELRGPNTVWYGHLKTTAIKSKGGGKK